MDKSPSINGQDIEDGSWDETEDGEELLPPLQNLSPNSWDSSSERGGKTPLPDGMKSGGSDDDWPSSGSRGKVLKARERPASGGSGSSASIGDDVLPAGDGCDLIAEDFDAVEVLECGEPGEDVFEVVEDLRHSPVGALEGAVGGVRLLKREQCLVVEDLEEPEASDEEPEEPVAVGDDSDPDDDGDVTMWKIPLSGRTPSTDDSESTDDILQNVESGRFIRKKSKSSPSVVRPKRDTKRSKSCEHLSAAGGPFHRDALTHCEGSQVEATKGAKKDDLPDILDITDLGDRQSHFQEVECRTLRTIMTNMKKEAMEGSESDEVKEEAEGESFNHPGTSGNVSEEAVSLPDIAGAARSPQFRKTASYTANHNLRENSSNLSESWILLDEMGKSQPVTLTEVNFLLNGRSADAVLQENKEHFIPKSAVVRNANSDLRVDGWNPLVEESLQHFLTEEEPVGEESASKSIRLERKFGNMLLYIQSGVNLTSSVRFIPVDTEMIHMWRQSKDNVSPISSEDDARLAMSENITEETSEYDNQETSDDVRCKVHESYRSGPTVRKRRTRQNKSDDFDHRAVENRMIIESLTDDIKQLRMRLEAERSRSSSLEQEICRLRGQLDKWKSGQSSTESKTKSEATEDCKKGNDVSYVPEVTSSSLLSIEEFRQDSEGGRRREESQGRRPEGVAPCVKNDPKEFKEALDKNLNDIEEILKCRNRSQGKPSKDTSRIAESAQPGQYTEDNSRMSSSVSVNTYAVVESSSQVLSEVTGSVESLFKLRKLESSQKGISDVINELERENERLVMENLNLKRKLNEISVELDDYISSCVVGSPVDDGRQTESLRNQVCNLKLELENLKSLAKNKEQSYKLKDAIVREELAEKSVSLEEWRTSILSIFRDVDEWREKLLEVGVPALPDPCTEMVRLPPSDLLSRLRSLMTGLTAKVVDVQRENSLLRRSIQESLVRGAKAFNVEQRHVDVNFLSEVPELIFGSLSAERNEYRALLVDKTTLEEEMRSLRKENALLLEFQLAHNEKLKRSTAAHREEKSRAESMEKALRILEIEKEEMSQALLSYQKDRGIAESELQMERGKLAEVRVELERSRGRVEELEEKLQEAVERSRSCDEGAVLKDEVIGELRRSCQELESREGLHADRIQFLSDELKKLEVEKAELEEELRSTKHIAEDSSRGMTQYISHLETMVGNAEDSLAEMKDKLNETLKSFAALKKAHEDLERQHGSNVKMLNKARDDLDNCRQIIRDLEESNRRSEEGKRAALNDLNAIVKSEREKTQTLEKMVRERKELDEEVSTLRVRAETQAKTKDRLMKEQKDFVNEIAILKKEKGKLAQKYRAVKSECNERTKLLKCLDGKIKENVTEYNRKLACLERNVVNIIEKAEAYKDTFLESRSEVKAVVRELQEQLEAAYSEKRDLESEAANFYAAMKHLQREVNDRRGARGMNFAGEKGRTREETSDGASGGDREAESRLRRAEADLAEAQEKLRQLEGGKEEERRKYEAIIADLKSQISTYQVRLDVMLKNISTYGKNIQEQMMDKREAEEGSKVAALEQKVRELTEELERKRKRVTELTEVIDGNETEMRRKGDECDTLREKVLSLKEEIKGMRGQFAKLQEFLGTVGRNVETYQKERDELAEKLAKSLKAIVEEKASKHSSEAVFAEKEKMLKEMVEQLQVSLSDKKKDYEALQKVMEEKKSVIGKLQDDVKRWKSEVGALKSQVTALKERRESEGGEENCEKQSADLRELRTSNLELRKREGALQARIICLEDELRGARLMIKELEGDLRSERTSKKLLKEMIASARNEIDKCKKGGQMASIADKVERHLNLSQVHSRELFSGYRAGGDERKILL